MSGFILCSCKKDADNLKSLVPQSYSVRPQLIPGEAKVVSTTNNLVSPGNYKINLNQDSVLGNLEFIISENAWSGSKFFSVSLAPVLSHTMGQDFLPLTPVIGIQANFLYANTPIQIKVPIQLPPGYFAMGDNSGLVLTYIIWAGENENEFL